MFNSQENLLNALKLRVHKKLSFINLISSILNIGYDAAYRRVTNKTTLSLNEAVILARHFNLSLNQLFNTGDRQSFLITKSKNIGNRAELEKYFISAYNKLNSLLKGNNANIYYCANDLPVFYFMDNTILSKFKNYVWLNLLDSKFSNSKKSFKEFNQTKSLNQACKNVGAIYNQFNIIEIWNANILDKTFMQIFHYFQIGLLKLSDAIIICTELEIIIKKIEADARIGHKKETDNKTKFTLYNNEILSLGNQILIKSNDTIITLTPYSLLSYYIITNPEICNDLEISFKKQLEISNLLSSSEEKGRSLFFNKLYQKIGQLKNQLKIGNQLSII